MSKTNLLSDSRELWSFACKKMTVVSRVAGLTDTQPFVAGSVKQTLRAADVRRKFRLHFKFSCSGSDVIAGVSAELQLAIGFERFPVGVGKLECVSKLAKISEK